MSAPATDLRPRRRAARWASAVVGLALTAAILGPPAVAAASPPLPPPPVCATAVSTASGRVTSAPTPLPVPTSTVGGSRLSSPGLQLNLATGTPRPPVLRAAAWLVADLDTGAVVASCNGHVQLAPASTLKILTSLALAHRLNWSTRYVGLQADAATEGTRVGIVPGSSYTVRDLFHGLMLGSGNDAATALATLSGGMTTTAALMNTEAHRLGGFDTTAINDSGLDAPGQVTSVYDLALFGRAALADPLISHLVSTKTYTFPGRGDRPKRPGFQIQNHNSLLFRYPGATGVKNGYTIAAGGSYVGSATRNGHRYLVSVLRTEGGTWRLARRLLDWAFAAGPHTTPVGRLVAPGETAGPQATSTPMPSTPSTSAGSSTAAPTRRPTAQAGGTRAAASSGSGTPEDTRTGGIVLAAVGVLLVGGLTFAGERGRRRARHQAAGRTRAGPPAARSASPHRGRSRRRG